MNGSNRRVRGPQPPEPAPRPPSPGPPKGASRWLATARTVLGVALVASASVAVAWVARLQLLTSPRFAVADVHVEGNERRAADALIAEAGLSPGANVFSLDLDAARARLLADPWIAEVRLARRLPGTVLVQVTERKAAALVAIGDLYLATAEGEPFKRLEGGDAVDLPLVTGLGAQALLDDHEGAVRSVRRAIDLAAEYERGSLSRRAPLQEVHLESDGSFALVVGRSGTELKLGAPPFRRKLEQAARVIAEVDRRGGRPEVVMLDNDTRPERVVVRMR